MGSGFLHRAAAACPADLLARAKERGTCRLLVVRASAPLPMEAAFEAVQADIVEPVLVGEPEIIKAEAEKLGWTVPDDSSGTVQPSFSASAFMLSLIHI